MTIQSIPAILILRYRMRPEHAGFPLDFILPTPEKFLQRRSLGYSLLIKASSRIIVSLYLRIHQNEGLVDIFRRRIVLTSEFEQQGDLISISDETLTGINLRLNQSLFYSSKQRI